MDFLDKKILFPLIKRKFKVTCIGLENIPPNENFIFASNHQSIADVWLDYVYIRSELNHNLHIILSHRFYYALWPIAKRYKILKMDMNKKNKKDQKKNDLLLQKAVQKMNEGNSILIFPEGYIHGGQVNKVIHGYTGAVRLAIMSKKPIIPIGTRGSNKSYPFLLNTKNPFIANFKQPITTTIGEKLTFDEYYDMDLRTYSEKNRRVLRELTEKLMVTLSDLSGLEYDPSYRVNEKTGKLVKTVG